jgi:proline iminopeptidase
VAETPFQAGPLRGHRGSSGPPALLLHGGAAVPDYLGGLAGELGGLFTTYRYTQRGTRPSGGGPPFTIEQHMADALSVLDAFGIERAWAVGHSWGGHLALHLLVAHPERLLGVVAVDPLGAFPRVFTALDAALRKDLTADEVARLDDIEALRRAGAVDEADLVERFRLLWPLYFADRARALPAPEHVGVEASIGTNRSLAEHYARRTLLERLPEATLPLLVVHGELSPLPVRGSAATVALVPGARLVVVPGASHFPWVDVPGSVRDAVEPILAKG